MEKKPSFNFPGATLEDVFRKIALENVILPGEEQEQDRVRREALDFYLNDLRSKQTDEELNLLENHVLEEMSRMTGRPKGMLVSDVLTVRKLEANPALLIGTDFPRLFKQAQKRVIDELRTRLSRPEKQVEFLVEKMVFGARKAMEKDYLMAKRELGDSEKAEDFAACLVELKFLSGQPIINEGFFRQEMLAVLKGGFPLELVHIKSLRYTYPEGKGVKILPNTDRVESPGIDGEIRVYPSEEVIFTRLKRIRALLKFYGIRSRLTLLVADRDLDYLFPPGNPLVAPDDLRVVKDSVGEYLDFLKISYKEVEEIYSLSEYLSLTGAELAYEDICQKVIREAKRGGSELVTERVLEMRVNYQYEHYREMFGKRYSRDQARYTAIYQIANLLALAVVFETFPKTPILMIDGRGFEDKLIGGYNPKSRVIYRTKLKDPVEIKKVVE